jgi:ferric-dicitrate binding protein FerR (iron transport regulator)
VTDRRRTNPGIGRRELDANEAERLWEVLGRLERQLLAAWSAIHRLEADAKLTRSEPPPGTVELQGPRGLRLRGAAWAVVLLVALGALVAVAWWWAPPRVPAAPQTHGGR